MNATLPDFLLTMLGNCPTAGAGVHAWLYATARQLHAHFPNDKPAIADILEASAVKCGRHVPRREIEDAIRNSEQTAWQPKSGFRSPAQRAWPNVNAEQREAILREGVGLVGLWESSPVRLDSNESQTEAVIDVLFPGNPLLCCGVSNSEFNTAPRELWRGRLSALSLIVPSPMSALTGITKEGKESKHTLNNTGPRRFVVIEFDSGTFDHHASLLFHLAGYGPLVLAVHSGSKSLHGWFYCGNADEDRLRRFMRYAVSLGADHATWTKSQFVRMPDGTRENGSRQAVYFLHPQLIKGA